MPLLRNRGLLAVLVAETVSTTGSQMTWLALPWFVLATSGSATRMGLVVAAELAGVAIFGVPGGALSARLGARRTLLATNVLAAPLVLSVPLLHWSGLLSFPVLLAIVFVTGTLWAPYFAAQRVVLPELLGEDEGLVASANALLQAAQRVTLLLGPIAAGVLIGFFGAPTVLVVDAATFVFAFVVLAAALPTGVPVERDRETSGVLAGLRFVARDRLLRAWTVTMAVGDAAWQMLFALLPFYAFTRYDGDARVAGALFACFGLAAVVGNALSFRVRRRVDSFTVIAWGVIAQALPLWMIVAAGPAWVIGLALVLSGLANGVVNPSLHTLLTMSIPPALRSQALTAILTVSSLTTPIGYFGAGVVLDHFGLLPILVAVPAIQTVTMGLRALATLRARGGAPGTRGAPEPRGPVRKGSRRTCRAKSKRGQDAHATRPRATRIRARPRTRPRAALQPAGARSAFWTGP